MSEVNIAGSARVQWQCQGRHEIQPIVLSLSLQMAAVADCLRGGMPRSTHKNEITACRFSWVTRVAISQGLAQEQQMVSSCSDCSNRMLELARRWGTRLTAALRIDDSDADAIA